jgi:hypothetical protein
MSEFLNSVKADLSSRSLRPFLLLAVVCLLGAVAYAVLGGGSSSSSSAPSAPVPTPSALAGLQTKEAMTKTADAETPQGAPAQRKGVARNPFASIAGAAPAAKNAVAAAAAAQAKAGASSGGASPTPSASSTPSTSSASEGVSGTTTPSQPSTPQKPKKIYHVTVLFGVVTPDTPLTSYENLKLLAPIPSTNPLVVYRGVTKGGKSAAFTLVSEAILHGPGKCLPSADQCQAVALRPGQSEQFEYLGAEGGLTTYELEVIKIASANASTASLRAMASHSSRAGREVLRRAGLVEIPDLRASAQSGVLEFASHASSARAHASARRHGR